MYSYHCNNSKTKALPVVILCYSDGRFKPQFGTGASETDIERTNCFVLHDLKNIRRHTVGAYNVRISSCEKYCELYPYKEL